jgi:ribonuclease HII
MAILAGIDEAGFGPTLGPLVVSASVFRVRDDQLNQCLWQALAGAVTRRATKKSAALPVADSKELRVREGLIHLERGVLGMARQLAPLPATLGELLRRACPAALAAMPAYPWYAGADLPLPRSAGAADVNLRANALAEAMARQGVALAALRAEPVLEGDFNRLVRATRNKHVALFGITCRLIAYVFQAHAAGTPTRIVVDHQGGKTRYLPDLQRMFETARIRIVQESDTNSTYLVQDGPRSAEISFTVSGESACLATALASMVSKYLRELFMELFNAWWAGRVPGLKPTAGYYTDGQRFLQDIAAAIAAEGIDPAMLIRER